MDGTISDLPPLEGSELGMRSTAWRLVDARGVTRRQEGGHEKRHLVISVLSEPRVLKVTFLSS